MTGPSERDEVAALLHPWLDQTDHCPWRPGSLCPNAHRSHALAAAILASDWLAERDRRTAATAVRDLVRDIDSTGYGWTSVVDAERFKDRLRDRADRIERGE